MPETKDATAEGIAKPKPRPDVPPEMLDVRTVGAMLNCSPRHVYRLADAGKLPRPLKVGALIRWRRVDVLDWIGAGCPSVRPARGAVR